jgi:hypothetical protein
MAHFAKLNENNIVVEVHCVNNNELLIDGVESEEQGIAFLTTWSNGYTNWKQTSYNGSFRANYAGVGYTYDPTHDVFYAPRPYLSWTMAAPTWIWQPPTPMPIDEYLYNWDEATLSWSQGNLRQIFTS